MAIRQTVTALLLLLGLSGPVFADATGGPAILNKFLALVSINQPAVTEPTVFEDVITASFSVAGRLPSCVSATVSFEFAAVDSDNAMLFQALLDGNAMEGSPVNLGTNHPRFSVFGYTFWRCGVRPGVHRIEIQWIIAEGSSRVVAGTRTLVVQGR